jgi:hypothetical protein
MAKKADKPEEKSEVEKLKAAVALLAEALRLHGHAGFDALADEVKKLLE